jgi:hypothetical protein
MSLLKKYLQSGNWDKCYKIINIKFNEISKDDIERLVYRLVDNGHYTGNIRNESYFKLFDKIIELKIPSRFGLQRALECDDIVLADKLYNSGYTIVDNTSIIFSLNAMLWAKKNKLKMFPRALSDIITRWNGEAVTDRAVMLFRDFNYIDIVDWDEIDSSITNTTFTAIFPYIKRKFEAKCILEKATKMCVVPIITFYKNLEQEHVIDYNLALENVLNYDEISIICAYANKLTKDVFVHVLLTNQEDEVLSDIINSYFNNCYKDDYLMKAALEAKCFEKLIEKNYFDSAMTLGRNLNNTQKIDWTLLMNAEINSIYEYGPNKDHLIEFITNLLNKYEGLVSIKQKKLEKFKILKNNNSSVNDLCEFLESL